MFYYFMFYNEDNSLFKVIKKLDKQKTKNLIFYGDKKNLNSDIVEFNNCLITEGNEYFIFYLSKNEKVLINEEGLCIVTKTKLTTYYIEKIIRNPFIFFE